MTTLTKNTIQTATLLDMNPKSAALSAVLITIRCFPSWFTARVIASNSAEQVPKGSKYHYSMYIGPKVMI